MYSVTAHQNFQQFHSAAQPVSCSSTSTCRCLLQSLWMMVASSSSTYPAWLFPVCAVAVKEVCSRNLTVIHQTTYISGYEMLGSDVIYCNQSEGWENTTLLCEIMECPQINLTVGLIIANNATNDTTGNWLHCNAVFHAKLFCKQKTE